MKQSHFKYIYPWLAVVVWMGVIFYLSHQSGNASSHLSSGITDGIIQTMETVWPFMSFDEAFFHHLIRKCAHFAAYFILGILVVHALKRPFKKRLIYALLICMLYAMSDEIHQLFVPGRSGEVRDVLIDSAGAATGIGLYMLFVFILQHLKENKRNSPPIK